MIDYIERRSIFCDLTCDWMSRLVTFNHMLNYVLTQLVYFPWLGLSILIPMTWSNYFCLDMAQMSPIPYSLFF